VTARKDKEWSVTGGARFAREARIATVRYLQDAPIARPWHLSKLLSSVGYHLAHHGNQAAAWATLFGGLGYRPPWPASWEEAIETILGDEARYLAEADLYVLTPQMCDVVVAAAQSLTREDLELISRDDMPGPAGLIVLPHPVIVRAVTGELADLRGFTWRYPMQLQVTSDGSRQLRHLPAVRMSTYHDTNGPVRPDTFLDFAAQARAQRTPLPPLLLDAMRCLPLQYKASGHQVDTHQDFVTGVREMGGAVQQVAADLGFNENRVVGEYVSGAQVDDADDTFAARFLYAFWRLCEQRIAATDQAGVNHSARVLAERAGVSPDVRIVRLRRIEQAAAGPGQPGREWHHRWVVRMHKVRQWYPNEGQHKIIYRGPYVKGPEDKPFLEGEIVQGLIR
jgi:hypothetical protein